MNQQIIGIDLGGTNVRAGIVTAGQVNRMQQQKIQAAVAAEAVLEQLFAFTDAVMEKNVQAIGIGVPGLVDESTGTVYDVVNIPAWKEVPLRRLMEARYGVPVVVNNDANCFALGEFYFGQGQGSTHMIGLTIGTGLGGGIILNKKLHSGVSGGAGEFGMMPYKEHCYEYYASGQFFQNVYGIPGEEVYKKACSGDTGSLKLYEEMGAHLGNAIQAILFALDIKLIVLGGSVRSAFPFFSKAMWQVIERYPFRRTADQLEIKVSELGNSGILGAAALYFDELRINNKH